MRWRRRWKDDWQADAGALFLNARAAVEIAGKTAAIMAGEFGRGEEWAAHEVAEFEKLAAGYMP